MPKVLFLTQTHNVWGGMESWVHNFSLWLQSRGWRVAFGLTKGSRFNDPEAYRAAHPHMEEVYILDASVGTEFARRDAIRKACRQSAPDIVIPIALGAVFPSISQLKRSGAGFRLVVPVRSMYAPYMVNIAQYFDAIDMVVGVNRLIQNYYLGIFPAEKARIQYVRRGVPPPVVSRFISSDVLQIGYVGRLEHISKRVFDLAELCTRVEHAGVRMRVHVFGNGPDESELRARLAGTGVCAVEFHGYVTPDDLYRKAYPMLDILLLFSPTEGSPTVVYESMAHGVVPVISRYLGHATEGTIRHGDNGLTFPVGDMRMAAQHLLLLARDKTLLGRLSNAAAQELGGRSDDAMHTEWEGLLKSALARSVRVPRTEPPESNVVEASGRLDRIRLPQSYVHFVRTILRRHYPHRGGFEEWPGSQPVSAEALKAFDRSILNIENEAAIRLYEPSGSAQFSISAQGEH